MNCNQANRQLSAYLDRELAGDEMLAVREHLNDCYECSVELEQLKRLKTALGQTKVLSPDPALYSRVKEAVYGPAMTKTRRQRGWAIMALTACASSLMVAVVFAQSEEAKSPVAETTSGDIQSESTGVASNEGAYLQMYPVKY